MSRAFTFDEIHQAAAGRWRAILADLGVDADRLNGKPGPCPGCGGRDRFTFDDRQGRGDWICRGGGDLQAGDGFKLLQHIHGWEPAEALRAVADHLGVEGQKVTPSDRRRWRQRALIKPLLFELEVLRVALSDRERGLVLDGNDTQREHLAVKRIRYGLGEIYG